MSRSIFFTLIGIATAVDAWLIAHPNLLGKLGMVIYKMNYLRTFPRALLTVSIVVIFFLTMTEIIRWLKGRKAIPGAAMNVCLLILLIALVALLIKTHFDFQAWAYAHTGRRLRYGAYLLPILLMFIVSSPWWVGRKKTI